MCDASPGHQERMPTSCSMQDYLPDKSASLSPVPLQRRLIDLQASPPRSTHPQAPSRQASPAPRHSSPAKQLPAGTTFDDDDFDIGGLEDIPLQDRLAAQIMQQQRQSSLGPCQGPATVPAPGVTSAATWHQPHTHQQPDLPRQQNVHIQHADQLHGGSAPSHQQAQHTDQLHGAAELYHQQGQHADQPYGAPEQDPQQVQHAGQSWRAPGTSHQQTQHHSLQQQQQQQQQECHGMEPDLTSHFRSLEPRMQLPPGPRSAPAALPSQPQPVPATGQAAIHAPQHQVRVLLHSSRKANDLQFLQSRHTMQQLSDVHARQHDT